MAIDMFRALGATALGLLVWTSPATAQAVAGGKAGEAQRPGSEAPGALAPSPAGPYPLKAAGWGPDAGHGLSASRWAEDWTGLRAAGRAPALKAIPLGGGAFLTLSTEFRLRYDAYDNRQLVSGEDPRQLLFRAVVGAELRVNDHLRAYGELGTGQVQGRRSAAGANFQNGASLQQAFLDARGTFGSILVGALLGRQEFADGPRQLLSLGDGPNLHRTWNGARVYAHTGSFRLGAFDLRATRLERGSFDDGVQHGERLQGINGSVILASEGESNTFLDPFWFHSENPKFRAGGQVGRDERDTLGARVWGRRGSLRFDWTLARQSGQFLGRGIDAWGLFAVQSWSLSRNGWKPVLTAHLDIASGGGAYGTGRLRSFNHLYASSGYLGEGQFLSLSNLLLIAPGVSVAPTPATSLSFEVGFARRLAEGDAAYAGGMRAYAGTQSVPGRELGRLYRVTGTWSVCSQVNLFFNVESLAAGTVLRRAGRPSGSYGQVGATFRY